MLLKIFRHKINPSLKSSNSSHFGLQDVQAATVKHEKKIETESSPTNQATFTCSASWVYAITHIIKLRKGYCSTLYAVVRLTGQFETQVA